MRNSSHQSGRSDLLETALHLFFLAALIAGSVIGVGIMYVARSGQCP